MALERRVVRLPASWLFASALALGCGEDGGDSAPRGSPGSGASSSFGTGGSFGISTGGTSSGGGAFNAAGAGGIVKPPEQEIESSFLVPVVTGKFVWSANPTSGRVALIDASSLAVRVLNAGFGPRYLAAIPGGAGAIVINELSHDATLFRLGASGEVQSYEGRLPIHEDANAWTVSPDSAFAIAWSDASGLDPLTSDASLGYQDISVVSIAEGQERVTRLVVGYRPTQLVVNAASTRAFAVTEDGISVIELGAEPRVSALYETTSDPLADVSGRDVSISPDGKLALIKVSGSPNLDVVDLESGELSTLVMSGPIEDLDLAADGTRAFAVIGTSEVVVVPVPVSGDPSGFDRVSIGSEAVASIALSKGGEVGVLYMNALPNSHVTILDTRAGATYLGHRTADVKGPVQAVFPAPNAETAILFQEPVAGSTKPGMFSVVPTLSERSAKIVGVDAKPTAVAFSPDGKYALVTTGSSGPGPHGVYRVKLDNLQEDLLELASPPIDGATGLVPDAARGFVAQAHPEGRITFIELESGQAHTLTGFELAAKISYGTD